MFNYRHEKEKFDRNWKLLEEEYHAAGMSSADISKMRDYDWDVFKKSRNETNHSSNISLSANRDDGINVDFILYSGGHYIEIENELFSRRLEWVEHIDHDTLASRLKSLGLAEIELLTEYIIDDLSQAKISEKYQLSQRAISKRIKKIILFLKNGSKK